MNVRTIPVHGLSTARKLAHRLMQEDPTFVAVIRPSPEAIEEFRTMEELHYDETRAPSCVGCEPDTENTLYILTLYPYESAWAKYQKITHA